MSVELTKGANTALSAARPGLASVLVGIGWDDPTNRFDVAVQVLLCDAAGQVPRDSYLVAADGVPAAEPAAPQAGSGQSGTGSDQEAFEVDLDAVPQYLQKIVFAATLRQAAARKQAFGQVEGMFIRVADLADGTELARYPLRHDCGGETALAFGELYRHRTGWKFRAIGQGWADGLAGLARYHGAGTA